MEKSNQQIKPLLLLIATNILGMLLIMLKSKEAFGDMIQLCTIMCVLSVSAHALICFCKMGDAYLFVIISMLSSVGIIMQTRIDPENGIRQMKLYLLGVGFFFITVLLYRTLHKHLKKLWVAYFSISVLLFAVTAVFGTVHYGSKNWIVIGGVSVQPSEFIRILFVLTLAAVLTKGTEKAKRNKSKNISQSCKNINGKRLIISAVVAYSNAFCLLLQREWGISLLFFAIYLAFLYIYGENRLFFGANILMVIFAGIIGVNFMSHIKVRVSTWLYPFADVTGKGYQITQSLFAIGEGGFAGRGIGNGSPYFIPVVSSDFIFSAICEEMGVLGGMAIIMLFFVLVYRGFKIALSSTNEFNKAVCVGLSVMLGVQTFIIVGGVIKLIPLTGITLPFISYGGSSMISTFIVLGILQAISGMKGEVTDEIE